MPGDNRQVLDPRGVMPLYRQLADELLLQVEQGVWREGARIPSEHDLARRHRVGRPTVRQATEVLVRQGILERRRGSGTFVGKARSSVDLFSLSGTFAAFRGAGVEFETKLVERARLRRVPSRAEQPFAGHHAITLTRLSSVERTPVILEQLFLDPELFAGVGSSRMRDDSLSDWLREVKGQRPSGGRQVFAVESVRGRPAAWLKVPEGTPLLVVLRTLEFSRAATGLFARMTCRTDEVQLAQNLGADGSIAHHIANEVSKS